ncbi:DUF975 family protein [Lapidilactobacillus achengensis]|uniref:DUF975 family protein n=1 Tax=Lapidilactobacillus achengensis TaxID=2486000 RepID=A0ABW1UMZ5_9LACO|nr:DUF975 family protein [Lapidilactobacillus achengensis]
MATILTRAEIKQQAKARFRDNKGAVLALNSVAIILSIFNNWQISHASYQMIDAAPNHSGESTVMWKIVNSGVNLNPFGDINITFTYSGVISDLFIALLTAGITIASLRWLRQPKETPLTAPFKQQFLTFSSTFFIPFLVLYLLSNLATLIGTILLVVPGILLLFAFQPLYLLYSDIGADDGYFAFLKTCWTFMKGHKWDWFVFELSFLLWELGIALTLGLLAIYVVPYYNLATAGFYESIRLQNNELATSAN